MTKEIISTKNAPGAIGPYSQGVKIGNLVYTSGQLPLCPVDGKLVTTDDIKVATKQCFENLKAVLEAAGTSLDKAVKVLVFLKDFSDFAAMNEVYATYITENHPARSCVQAAKLPLDAIIEIEVVAYAD